MTHGVGGGKSTLVVHVHRHRITAEAGRVCETPLAVLRLFSLDELHNWHRELHSSMHAPLTESEARLMDGNR